MRVMINMRKHLKNFYQNIVMAPFLRKVTVWKEEAYLDKRGPRKIDVCVLECECSYWQEKAIGRTEMIVCSSCFRLWCYKKGKWGERLYEWWDKRVRGRMA